MKKEKDFLLTDFKNKLNYKFKKKTILKEALTHSSFYNKNLNDKITSNERLEFLGDSVLELIVSEYLYLKLLSFSEGKLTKIKSIIVSKTTLTKWANSISLGKYIILGKGEDLTGGRNKSSILSSCFEALLGAIYLDSGFKKVKKYILSFLNEEIKTIE
ncbi:MAG: ribonuclease III, partial [Candidatus Atribacteria bacterium]|nr:ribonuclease III [Candidatus Atribacteria bacterium]